MTHTHTRAALVATACLSLAWACDHADPYEKPLTPVLAESVGREPTGSVLRYSAVVEPVSRIDLAFRVGGYVTALAQVGGRTIQDGDPVTAGLVLASVRAEDYEAKIAQGRAALAEAEAARGAAAQALTRAEALYASRSLTRPDLEQARAAVESIDARIGGARALIREAELARADADLRSPIAGVVLRRLIEQGSLVGPGTPAFAVADTSTVKVVIGVPDTMVQRFAVGSSQRVQSEAVPDGRFEGRITKVAPTADPRSRLFDVELSVPNPGGVLRPGMVVTVAVAEPGRAATPDTIALPLSAIVRAPGGGAGDYAVFVLEDGAEGPTARLRRVRLGDLVGNRIAVTEGLTDGERVIVRGGTVLADGERVNPTR